MATTNVALPATVEPRSATLFAGSSGIRSTRSATSPSRDSGGLAILLPSTLRLASLAPTWILLSVPTVVHNALSAYAPQHELLYHYHLEPFSALFIAAAMGVRRIGSLDGKTRIAMCAATSGQSSFGRGRAGRPRTSIDVAPAERALVKAVLDRVPPSAPVAAAQSPPAPERESCSRTRCRTIRAGRLGTTSTAASSRSEPDVCGSLQIEPRPPAHRASSRPATSPPSSRCLVALDSSRSRAPSQCTSWSDHSPHDRVRRQGGKPCARAANEVAPHMLRDVRLTRLETLSCDAGWRRGSSSRRRPRTGSSAGRR